VRAEAAAIEQGEEVGQHLRAAADHRPVEFGVQRLQASCCCMRPLAIRSVRAAMLVAAVERERLARHRRVVLQLGGNLLAEELMPRQLVDDVIA